MKLGSFDAFLHKIHEYERIKRRSSNEIFKAKVADFRGWKIFHTDEIVVTEHTLRLRAHALWSRGYIT